MVTDQQTVALRLETERLFNTLKFAYDCRRIPDPRFIAHSGPDIEGGVQYKFEWRPGDTVFEVGVSLKNGAILFSYDYKAQDFHRFGDVDTVEEVLQVIAEVFDIGTLHEHVVDAPPNPELEILPDTVSRILEEMEEDEGAGDCYVGAELIRAVMRAASFVPDTNEAVKIIQSVKALVEEHSRLFQLGEG